MMEYTIFSYSKEEYLKIILHFQKLLLFGHIAHRKKIDMFKRKWVFLTVRTKSIISYKFIKSLVNVRVTLVCVIVIFFQKAFSG